MPKSTLLERPRFPFTTIGLACFAKWIPYQDPSSVIGHSTTLQPWFWQVQSALVRIPYISMRVMTMSAAMLLYCALGGVLVQILDCRMRRNAHDDVSIILLRFRRGVISWKRTPGHCKWVDPFYLMYKAKQLGHGPQVIGK